LLLHRVGTPEADDELVLQFPEDDQLIFWPELSHDNRWVVVSIVKGTENRNRLWAYPVTTTEGRSTLGEPVPVVTEPVAEFGFLRTDGDRLWLQTDLDAPRGRVVACPIVAGTPTPELTEVVPEGPATLAAAVPVGDLLVTETLVDATPQLDRWTLTGEHRGRIEVAGGAVVGISGEPGDPEGFVGLSSVTSPTRAYRIDVDAGTVEPLDDLVPTTSGGWTPPPTRTERLVAVSADGTQVPYFLVVRADLDLGRPRPTLLYGYGGFKIPVLADYRPGWSGWLAAGGVLAIANLRGGGEFGSDWYDDGRGPAKQHVFDDFVAVAEHLKATGVTTTGQLALHGRSNGGLLVGAVLTQRPDLAAVALPGVGVLDLLRFHLFTYGRAWVSDFGDPDDPDDFAVALAYSPVHNVVPGTAYPATLVTTGDHDDRVVPLHSHKFTAALQHAQAGPAPVLTRIEVATGHGMGKPTALVAAEWADLLAFAAHHTGLHPAPDGPGRLPR
jgi:prolyl oligopeptidase